MRNTKTEFVSCPSCGRTLFDLQETTANIQKKTGHLPGRRKTDSQRGVVGRVDQPAREKKEEEEEEDEETRTAIHSSMDDACTVPAPGSITLSISPHR